MLKKVKTTAVCSFGLIVLIPFYCLTPLYAVHANNAYLFCGHSIRFARTRAPKTAQSQDFGKEKCCIINQRNFLLFCICIFTTWLHTRALI